ncbi:MAG: hypothetical protein HY907_07715 [Deltaproteobacteria bacterium]|nr:hypothetical protein [Deltaproteobacteria bacterium]
MLRNDVVYGALFSALVACTMPADDDPSAAALGLRDAPLRGAIFTTTWDGRYVNRNVDFDSRWDVYLDGGPGPLAPSGAAALPEGDYYFQVTDPAGKVLLSSDPIECRRIHVNAAGVIDVAYDAAFWEWRGDIWFLRSCGHATGVDRDHAAEGAITVQLFPYDLTPNRGAEYKVWVAPAAGFAPEPEPGPESKSSSGPSSDGGRDGGRYPAGGFASASSKTDNFKVREVLEPPEPPGESAR